MTDTFTSSLLADLAPFVSSQADPTGDHNSYLSALAQMFEASYSLAMDQGYPDDTSWVPGWSTLLNVQTCPAAYLPWLAMLVGATIPAGSSDAVARQVIQQESGLQRGTPGAVISAAQRNLSGTQSVILVERVNASGVADAYWFQLIVRPEEVINATQLTADVNNVKPGGVMWTLVQTDGFTWSSAIHTWAADTFSWQAADSTQP